MIKDKTLISVVGFTDRTGKQCTLQESDITTEHCIWLGSASCRPMHLTQDMVRELLPYLQRFVESGHL